MANSPTSYADAPGASSRVFSSRERNAFSVNAFSESSKVWLSTGQRGTEKKERKFMYPSKQNYDHSRSFF